MVKIRRLVHAGLEIETGSINILIDPGRYCFVGGHPSGVWRPEDFRPNLLLFTHAHGDHFEPETAAAIIRNSNPKVYGSREVVEGLREVGIEIAHLPVGQRDSFSGIPVRSVPADHRRPGETIGFVITVEGRDLYHCGDTHYMAEKPGADVVFVPIGNLDYTMGPDEAARFVREINPQLAVPIHYESPKMNVRPEQFAEHLRGSNIECKILAPGEWMTL